MKININKAIIIVIVIIIVASFLSSCNTDDDEKEINTSNSVSGIPVYPVENADTEDMFTNRDTNAEYDLESGFEIKLSDASGSCTITKEGTYIFSGALSNGQIIVDADSEAKIQIVLNGVDISCDTSAALYIKQADKVIVTLNEDTTNILSNKDGFVQTDDNNIDSAIFSKDDLTINGNGTLIIQSPYGNGILSKDNLVLVFGIYLIDAMNHGIEAKDCIKISGSNITINSGKDGIHADNDEDSNLGYIYIETGKFDLTSLTDGISASGCIQIDSGDFRIISGGGSINSSTNANGGFNQQWGVWSSNNDTKADSQSAKGIKSAQHIIINNSIMNLDTSDDSLHSNTTIVINDGIYAISSGDDGMHADTQIVINGGNIEISKSYEGIESQKIDITGGNISIYASDDGLNAAGGNDQSAMGGRPGMGTFNTQTDSCINISGGYIVIESAGDGIDANGNITVSGGKIYISGPTSSGNSALDYDGNGQITGGLIIAAGSNGMAQNFGNSSTQGSILINLQSNQVAGSKIILMDSSNTVLTSFTPTKQYSSVLVSCPEIVLKEKYTIKIGNYSTEVTISSLIYGSPSTQGGQRINRP